MANGKQLNVNLAFNADTSKVKKQLEDLQKQLTQLMSSGTSNKQFTFSKDIEEATHAVAKLKVQLEEATNVNTGKLDLGLLNQSFKQAGTTLEQYRIQLQKLGPEGEAAFRSLASSILKADVPLKQTNTLLKDFATTLKNTAKWQISSSILHGFMGSIQSAYYYAEDLNESLNNIRIVTGQNVDDMARFAEEANNAAKALSTTTTAYTNASLIYYQQGLSDEEVKQRTDITIKMANVARESAEDVSQQMTAIWNNFSDGSKSLEHYADVMTALGAATASSTDEIAEGLEKFAAVADTVGLSYEYATSALATVTSQTRQSADIVGNAFKTIFARMEGLQLGKTLEDGVDLNKYSAALAAIGVNIKDVNGELKSMDQILNETGEKWKTLSKEQQVATAQTVAGVRQYTQFTALFDNWDFFKKNLEIANSATGALQEQADTYAESWEAAQDRVKASLESIWSELIKDDFFIKLNDGFAKFLDQLDNVIKGIGGVGGAITLLGNLIVKTFSQDIAGSIDKFIYNRLDKKNLVGEFRDSTMNQLAALTEDSDIGAAYEHVLQLQQAYLDNADKMTEAEKKTAQLILDEQENRAKNLITLAEERKTAEEALNAEERKVLIAGRQKGNSSEQMQVLKTAIADFEKVNTVAIQTKEAVDHCFDSLETDASLEEKLQSIREAFKGISVEGLDVSDEIKAAFDTIKNSTENTDQELNKVSKALQTLFTTVDTLGSELGLDSKAIEDFTLALIDAGFEEKEITQILDTLTKATDNYNQAGERVTRTENEMSKSTEETKKAFDGLKNKPLTAGQAMVKLANGLTSVVFAIQSLKGVVDTLNDEDMSFFDKFLSVTMSLGMSVPMLVSGIPAVIEGFKGLQAALAGTTAAGVATQAALLPLIGTIGGIIAVSALLVTVVDAFNKHANASAIHAQKMAEEAETLKNRYQELTTSANEFKTSVSNYEQGVAALAELDKSTQEYQDTLEKTNEQARELIETNKLFGRYSVKDGLINIDKDALSSLQKQKTQAANDAGTAYNMQEIATNYAKLDDQLNRVIKSVGVLKTYTDDVWDRTEEVRLTENGAKEAAEALYELKQTTERTSLTEEEWEEVIKSHKDTLPKAVTTNIKAISNNADALVEYQKSVNEASEANKYYAQEILGIEIEKTSGKHLDDQSKDEQGEVNSEIREALKSFVIARETAQKAKEIEDAANKMADKSKDYNNFKLGDETSTHIGTAGVLQEKYGLKNASEVYSKWAELNGYDPSLALRKNGFLKTVQGNSYDIYDKGQNVTADSNDENIYEDVFKALEKNKYMEEVQKRSDAEIASADKHIDALSEVMKKLSSFDTRYGVSASQAFAANFGPDSIDKLATEGFDFSSVFENIGEEGKEELKTQLLALADDPQMQVLFPDMFGEGAEATAEDFKNKIEDAFSKYDPTAYREKIAGQTHTVANSIGDLEKQVASGEINSDNVNENKDYQALLAQINQLRDAYPELEQEIDVINNKWLLGTQDYTIALEKVREQLQWADISNLATEQSEKIKDVLDKYSDGVSIKVDADTEEFEKAISDIVNNEYSIDIQVHSAMEDEFDSITNAFDQMHDMASKIGDDFIVAATDLRELNNTFPGILEGMQVLKDGTVQLNSEMVQSAMQGAEAEAQADAQAKIVKLKNAAVLLREKQALYEQMAEAARILAQGETATEEASANARTMAVKTMNEIKTKDEELASNSVIDNAKDVADNSKINAQIIGRNYTKSAQVMADAYYQAASNVIENMNQVQVASSGGGGAAKRANINPESGFGESGEAVHTTNSYSSGSSGGSAESAFDDAYNEKDQQKAQKKWAKVAEMYDQLAKSANETATDIEGMVAQIGASAGALDHALGGVAKGLGADGEKNKKGGGKEKEPDKKDKVKDELDRYFDINNVIAQINDNLTKNEQLQKKIGALQSHYFGNALVKYLKEQNQLLKQRNSILETQYVNYEKLYSLQKAELDELKAKLGGLWDGDILQNYSQLFQANLDKYNAVIEKYNAMSKEQQEKAGKTMLENAKKTYDEYKKNLERYQKLYYNEMINTENKLAELRQQQLENQLKVIENNLKAYEAKIQIELDKTKLQREWNDFIKEAQDDFRKIFSDLSLDSKLSKDNFGEYEKDVNTRIKEIQDVEKEIDKMEKAKNKKGEVVLDDDFKFGSISEAQEKLKELQSELVEAGKNLHDLYKQVWDNYIKGLDQAAEGFENINNEFEHINNELEYEKELIELVYGDKAYDLMNKYYETQQKSITGEIDSAKQQADFWKDQLNKAYEMNKDKHNVDMNDMSTWTEDMKKAYDEMIKSQEKLNDLILTGIKNLQEKYLNGVRKATEDIQKQIFNGNTLEDVRKNWDKTKKQSELYLDDTDKLYEITTLSNKINDSISDYANNSKAQQKLNKLRDDELKQLREKEKLTKYDIQLAEQRYQIALKELEIENAQENKNAMKLTRDESGNWTYQYVADEQEVENKKQELLDLIDELRQIAEEGETAMEDLWLESWEDYWERYQQITEDTTIREEEKLAKIEELNQEYWPLIESYGDLAQRYQQEAIAATAGEVAEACEQERTNYENLTEIQKQLVDSVKDHHIADYEDIRSAVIDDYDDMKNQGTEDFSELRQAARDTYKETSQLSKTTVGQIVKDWDDPKSKSSFKGAMTDAYNEAQKLTRSYEKELERLEKISEKNIMNPGGVVDDLDHIGEKTDEVSGKTDDMVDNATSRLDELRDFVEEVEDAWDNVIDKIQDAIDKLQEYISTMSEAQSVGNSKKSGSSSGGSSKSPSKDQSSGGGSSGGSGNSGSGSGGGRNSKSGNDSETYHASFGERHNKRGNLEGIMWIHKNSDNSIIKTITYDPAHSTREEMKKHYRSSYPGLRTGGYTGDWGDDSGRLAVLHKKELVLNANDTKNMLQMVNTIRDMTSLNESITQMITDSIGKIIAKTINTAGISNHNASTNNNQSTNVFNVTAEFPNANDVQTIKEAILNLPNIASQFIHQK